MGRRKEPRTKMVLPAKIWTDADGPFPLGQSCVTQNITRHGVCIEGVPNLKVGQVLMLAYHQKRSRFRVAWIGVPGSSYARLAGLENLEPEKLVFGVGFPPGTPDTFEVPESKKPAAQPATQAWDGSERRANARYDCAGDVEAREENGREFTSGKLTDISLGGCYVELMTPFPAYTRLVLVLTVSEMQLRLNGIVRVAHHDGMGIQFTESAAEDQTRLGELVNWLARGSVGEPGSAPQQAAATLSNSATSSDPTALLDALLQWFGGHNLLTRDDFFALLDRCGKAKAAPAGSSRQ